MTAVYKLLQKQDLSLQDISTRCNAHFGENSPHPQTVESKTPTENPRAESLTERALHLLILKPHVKYSPVCYPPSSSPLLSQQPSLCLWKEKHNTTTISRHHSVTHHPMYIFRYEQFAQMLQRDPEIQKWGCNMEHFHGAIILMLQNHMSMVAPSVRSTPCFEMPSSGLDLSNRRTARCMLTSASLLMLQSVLRAKSGPTPISSVRTHLHLFQQRAHCSVYIQGHLLEGSMVLLLFILGEFVVPRSGLSFSVPSVVSLPGDMSSALAWSIARWPYC